MYSLRDIATHALPENAQLPEVVTRTIYTDTKNKLSTIYSNILERTKSARIASSRTEDVRWDMPPAP